MTRPEARELQKTIHEAGLHCVVRKISDGDYEPEIITAAKGPLRFNSVTEWQEYKAASDKRRYLFLNPPQSPIDVLIDKACGLY